MLNRGLLLASGKAGGNQTIGEAGGQGFGVGVYGGDPADLDAMGLTPMDGCDDPSSDNYGNYVHTNGSIMCFIPAFCYRIGNPAAPSYARDNKNALEIRDASEGEGDGWILHRAFIDGGVQKSGFFIDKYICSKGKAEKLAVSVKYRNNISLSTKYENSSTMPNCSGVLSDAIALGCARGEHYSCVTAFQWSAISMLSLAHGQAATSNQFCGWYDANYRTNYPKGNNNNSLGDESDPSVKWSAHAWYSTIGLTGSGKPFNKTTHNGQNCGVTDVNGSQLQVVIGCQYVARDTVQFMKESVKAHDITKANITSTALNDVLRFQHTYNDCSWGADAFFLGTAGVARASCGILPRDAPMHGIPLFGGDAVYLSENPNNILLVAGAFTNGSDAGVWFRKQTPLTAELWYGSFRAAGYAS